MPLVRGGLLQTEDMAVKVEILRLLLRFGDESRPKHAGAFFHHKRKKVTAGITA